MRTKFLIIDNRKDGEFNLYVPIVPDVEFPLRAIVYAYSDVHIYPTTTKVMKVRRTSYQALNVSHA